MRLPDGVYLASGFGLMPAQPSFAESIVSASKREEQWQRIIDARANGRACAMFQNAADFIIPISSFTRSDVYGK
jgi:hypothetical protein